MKNAIQINQNYYNNISIKIGRNPGAQTPRVSSLNHYNNQSASKLDYNRSSQG